MKEKSEKCKYCEKQMEPKTTRGQFCSDKCRVYWNRENKIWKKKENTIPEQKQFELKVKEVYNTQKPFMSDAIRKKLGL